MYDTVQREGDYEIHQLHERHQEHIQVLFNDKRDATMTSFIQAMQGNEFDVCCSRSLSIDRSHIIILTFTGETDTDSSP